MQVILAASGGGSWGTMTEDCRQALENASCIIGARRLIEGLSETYTQNRVAATRPGEILKAIRSHGEGCVVLYSGDTGFYSGTRSLIPSAGKRRHFLHGSSRHFQCAAAFGGAWHTVAGLAALLCSWGGLQPGGSRHAGKTGVFPYRRGT